MRHLRNVFRPQQTCFEITLQSFFVNVEFCLVVSWLLAFVVFLKKGSSIEISEWLTVY